jgi:hypothetical protein
MSATFYYKSFTGHRIALINIPLLMLLLLFAVFYRSIESYNTLMLKATIYETTLSDSFFKDNTEYEQAIIDLNKKRYNILDGTIIRWLGIKKENIMLSANYNI